MRAALIAICALACLAAPRPTAAQARGYVQGFGGVTFATETDGVYGGGVAIAVGRGIDVFGEAGWMRNAISSAASDRVNEVEGGIRTSVAFQFGPSVPVEFRARVPAYYGLGGVRVRGPRAGRLATYIEGGFGVARLDPQLRLTVNGDSLDREAGTLTGITTRETRDELIASAGAGVSVSPFTRIRLEAGYRYIRIMGDDGVNVSRLHAGIGYVF